MSDCRLAGYPLFRHGDAPHTRLRSLKLTPVVAVRLSKNCLETEMIRTVFMIGLFALLGLFALKLVFGLFGALFGVLWFLLWIALKIALVGLVLYFVIRIVSLDTASRLRSKWSM